MLVSIGMLAWNEAENIDGTIRSLMAQTVFSNPPDSCKDISWELIVVPNGCSDATAAIARKTIAELVETLPVRENFRFDVIELAKAGKSNAWNHYVHEFSHREAQYIILIDADIHFGLDETIANVLHTARANEHADVVLDLPLKDIAKRERKSLFDRISLKLSDVTLKESTGISGQFYCAKADVLRGVWMPEGLSGEDGFLKTMITTDLFRKAPDASRLIRAPNALHYYTPETTLERIFKHQARMKIGTALNCFLTWDTLKFMTDPNGPGAGTTIQSLNRADPDWYRKFMRNTIANKGWWVLPKGMVFGRFAQLRSLRGANRLGRALFLMIALTFDLPVLVYVNKKLKNGSAIGYW